MITIIVILAICFDFRIIKEAKIDYKYYHKWSGGAVHYGQFIPSTIEFEDGKKVLLEVDEVYIVNKPCTVEKQILDSFIEKIPVNPQKTIKVSIKKFCAIKQETFYSAIFFANRRKVILNFPPAGTVWHLPAGISQLTSLLRRDGNEVKQRYGHIIGLEYVLNSFGGGGVANALEVIRSKDNNIADLYQARLVLEGVSKTIETPDKFRYERNNIYYHSKYQDGTVSGVFNAIRDRKNHLWYEYFANIEIPFANDFKPDIYGVSVGDGRQLIPGIILATMVKEAMPQCIVVVGGNFFARIPSVYDFPEFKELLNYFDGIVYAEGFKPLQEICPNGDLSKTSGLIWKKGDNLIVNKRTENPTDFGELSTPVFDGGALQFAPEIIPSLYTQSHCPMDCDFCDISSGSDTFAQGRLDDGKKIKPRSVSPRQIAENMKNTGCTKFDIVDELFPSQRQIELGRELKVIGYEAVWQCYMTITDSLLNPQIAKDLYQVGCRSVQFGLESLSKETLLRIHKQWNTPKNYDTILANFRNAGIHTHIFLIVGLPGERLSDSLKWVGFLSKYGKNILTIKSGRWRPARNSPEVQKDKLGSVVEIFPDTKPFSANRHFKYKNISNTKVDAMRDILEQACIEHWAYDVTSTIPWWINRSRFTWEQLEEMSKFSFHKEEIRHLNDRIAQMRFLVKEELGINANFRNWQELVQFSETLI